MNTKRLILIDKLIAKPFGQVLNLFVRLAGQIFNIDHNLNKEFKTIAICKFKGMGSILQATPMMEALHKRYPNATIIFVSTSANQQLLSSIHYVNKTVLINDKGFFKFIISSLKALITLIRIRPDVYIDLEIYSDFSTIFAAFTLSKNRLGFYLRSSSFRMGIYTHMMYFNASVPISKVYLQFASLFVSDIENAKLYPFLELDKGSIIDNNEYLIINPNASDLRLERRWGEQNFIQLIRLIIHAYPQYEIRLIGSKDEWAYTELIKNEINHINVINTAGTQSISELIQGIRHCKLMISNDTGPMHIAFCTQTPIVCLFGPCSPNQYFAGENAYFIYKKVYCSPCVHDFEVAPCHGNNICMKMISPDEVFSLVQEALTNQIVKPISINSTIMKYKNETIGLINR